MAEKEEHLRLAGIVKGVHADLRKKYKKNSDVFDEVWHEHCQNTNKLSEYADAMHRLAVDHWGKLPETRIDWCRDTTLEYFLHGGLKKVLEKEERRQAIHSLKTGCGDNCNYSVSMVTDNNVLEPSHNTHKEGNKKMSKSLEEAETILNANDMTVPVSCSTSWTDGANLASYQELCKKMDNEHQNAHHSFISLSGHSNVAVSKHRVNSTQYTTVTLPFEGKIRLLDVGSCFNGFSEFEEFMAIGIDISPAKPSVYHCDFLHLETTEPLQIAKDSLDTFVKNLKSPVEKLPKDSFHVVVFSLLLEYFPSPYQRWICCQKAYDLLMINGLLLIITPDSHQQHRNAPMMKSWKTAIESLGFVRWRYIKLEHLHCMAFRKIVNSGDQSLFLSGITPDMLYIPQDFQDIPDEGDPLQKMQFERNDDFCIQSLNELPMLSDSDD